MRIRLQITFRNMPPSEAIEKTIQKKAAKLEAFYGRIMGCRVTVEAPHRQHHKGKAYQVRIDLMVPGAELVVSRPLKRLEPAKLKLSGRSDKDLTESHGLSKHAAHADIYVAIRDVFNAAGRKLQDYARRQSLAVKLHEPPAHARIVKLDREGRYGFLETPDGREIYFHGNAVLQSGFRRLKVGTAVYYAEEEGEKGPQASTVRFVKTKERNNVR